MFSAGAAFASVCPVTSFPGWDAPATKFLLVGGPTGGGTGKAFMDWFRLYGDMPDDPKVGTLSDSEFRTWIELLCLACREERYGLTSATDGNVTWLLRRNVTDSLQVLLRRGLIYQTESGQYGIKAWENRQKKSDSSKQRVIKFRELQKSNVTETLLKRDGNGPEKKREEKKREEKKERTERTGYPPEFVQFWSAYPRHDCSKSEAFKSFSTIIREGIDYGRIITGATEFAGHVERTGMGQRYIPHAATWLNQRRWEAEYSDGRAYLDQSGRPPSEKQRTTAAYAAIIERRNAEADPGLQGQPEPTHNPAGSGPSTVKGLW